MHITYINKGQDAIQLKLKAFNLNAKENRNMLIFLYSFCDRWFYHETETAILYIIVRIPGAVSHL